MNNLLVKSITIILAILFTNINLFSQNKDSTETGLKGGNLAILFSINADFQLGAIDGVLISGKYHLSNQLAIRTGLGVYYTKTDLTKTLNENVFPRFEESYGYGINSYFVFYPMKKSNISPYLGTGPSFSYTRSKVKYSSIYTNYRSVINEEGVTIGLGFLLGVEWFPTANISFFAEYVPSISYKRIDASGYEIDETDLYYFKNDGDVITFTGNGARLGLSVYF